MTSDYHGRRRGDIVVVRLTRKLAPVIDGVDLSQCSLGDTAAFGTHDACLLIAEGWGEEIAERPCMHHARAQSVKTS